MLLSTLWRYLQRKHRLNARMRDFERNGMHYTPRSFWR